MNGDRPTRLPRGIAAAAARRALSRFARPETAIFLLLWLGYGLLINSGNLSEFNLQQIGVEAIVERGHFYLEGSAAPELYPRADVFLHDGHKYAAKQPGQFMTGALAYFFLRPLGFSYVEDYLLTSAAVTFLTTSLVTALGCAVVFRLARRFSSGAASGAGPWPLAAALCYGLSTTALAYAGIAHHDAIASAYLLLAFHLVVRTGRDPLTAGRESLSALGAGALLGLTLATSMLPSLMAAAVGVYALSLRRWRALSCLLAGAFAGLLPLFVYDAVSFGNPLWLPNVVGNYGDTFFRPGLGNFLGKLRFYAWMLAAYSPVFLLGVAGLALYPREYRREQALMLSMIAVLVAYVTNIETTGDCQYGPRYLLPAMPYACLGLVGFGRLGPRSRVVAALLVAAAATAGAFVNFVGAMHGAMYCPVERHALWPYLAAITGGELRTFPLARWLLAPLLAGAALFTFSFAAGRRARRRGD